MRSILISAGHSKSDPGACANDLREADLTLELRDLIGQFLKPYNLTVYEDGMDGNNEPLTKAISLAKKADIAVELHFNAGGLGATGVEALCKPNKKELAKKLCKATQSVLNLKLRGEQGWKSDNSGQHHRLGFCEAGGIILEVAFITNQTDMNWYVGRKKVLAESLATVLFHEALL